MKTKKVLIADDNTLFRRNVKEIFAKEPDIEIVGEARDGWETIVKAKLLEPDLLLLDIRMPHMNGIEIARQIKKELPKLKIVFLTIHDLLEYRNAAKSSGVDAFVLKLCMDKELMPAIRNVFNGKKIDFSKSSF